MTNKTKIYLTSLIIIPLFITVLSAFVADRKMQKQEFVADLSVNYPPNFRYLHAHDTIFVLNDRYIEIDLSKQFSYIHYSCGKLDSFPVSTGTDRITKGISTREGIYTVQTKIRLGISRQFNNAELINWVGYDGNIGFHGLKGNSYYDYLGKKPSSHGCVRISREDGAVLYDSVSIGTPVIVHSGQPARILSFCNYEDTKNIFNLITEDKGFTKVFKKRIDLLYLGKINYILGEKFALDGSQVLRRTRIDVGRLDFVPSSHENNFNYTIFAFQKSDKSSKNINYSYYELPEISEVSSIPQE